MAGVARHWNNPGLSLYFHLPFCTALLLLRLQGLARHLRRRHLTGACRSMTIRTRLGSPSSMLCRNPNERASARIR